MGDGGLSPHRPAGVTDVHADGRLDLKLAIVQFGARVCTGRVELGPVSDEKG
jgi:hypothetical protein